MTTTVYAEACLQDKDLRQSASETFRAQVEHDIRWHEDDVIAYSVPTWQLAAESQLSK